ncbi:MAG: phosphoadenylyl-sulfate reductase [bacterium]|nr:phosphoadenylyl-sulfate reductase [bacterium]
MKQERLMEDFNDLNEQFETASPQAVLQWAADRFGSSLAVVTSFQPTGIVTLHMLQAVAPQTPVLTLDTGLLFPETYTLVDTLKSQLALNLVTIQPQQTVEQQAAQYGDRLWERDPDQCCNLRKTKPLEDALTGYAAWITGLRRDQSDGRKTTPIISWDQRYQMVKLSPFATWTEEMVWTYIHAHELPYNTLHTRNYHSIGCWPCTRPVVPGEDKRAGRWAGQAKTECGIHLSPTSYA